ncbi:hypothetical protein [Aeromonas bivalvium]|uniref:hypothetical protein n=1 Tax=Aeromonas bivalvium TaxID=440079 RepID=UPI0038D2045C
MTFALAPTPNSSNPPSPLSGGVSPGGVSPGGVSPPLLAEMFSSPPHPPSKAAAIKDAKSPFFVAFILTTPINGKISTAMNCRDSNSLYAIDAKTNHAELIFLKSISNTIFISRDDRSLCCKSQNNSY